MKNGEKFNLYWGNVMNDYMEIANHLAYENLKTKVGGPFGACIVKDGKVISSSSNHVILNHDPTAHAEILAIREAGKILQTHDLSGCELYTTCYPCPMCMAAILWANIRVVYYGNTKEDADKIGFRDDFIYSFFQTLPNSCEITFHQIHREDTIKAFQEYAKDSEKVIY